MEEGGDPYRSAPVQAQFVCVVCWRSLSVHAGECPRCGVDRLSLADPEVRAEVRAEAEKRLQLKHYSEWFWCYLGASMLAFPVIFLHQLMTALVVLALTTLVVGNGVVKLYERLNPRSVLRLYADRRRRLAAPGTETRLLPAARADDPEDAELPRVLGMLGAKLD